MANKRIQRERKLIIILAALSVLFFALTFGIKALENRDVDLDQVYIDEASMTEYLSRLEITDGTGDYILTNEGGAWHLQGHDEVPISDLKITETRSVAKYFAPGRILTEQGDNLARFGLAEPQARVKMVSSSGEKTYLVGDFNPVTREYYVALEGSDTVFLLPKIDGDSLKKGIIRYVDDPPVVDLVFSELGEIRVSQGGRSYVIEFRDGKYVVTNDEGTFEAEHAGVMELFNCFTYSAGYECADYQCTPEKAAAYGLGNDAITVTFVKADGSAEYVMRAGTGSDGIHYMAESPYSIVYSVDDENFGALEQAIKLG